MLLEANLAREIYYHGMEVPIHVSINNNTRKSVKAIRVRKKGTPLHTCY